MNTDLFYTATSYKLSDTFIFPAIDVIGFNIQVDNNAQLPLHLHHIQCSRKVSGTTYIFYIADKNNDLYLSFSINENLDTNKNTYTLQIVDMNGVHAGVIVVNSAFIEWVYNSSFNSIQCGDNSIVFNPSYCSTYSDTRDFRLICENRRISEIILKDITCMKSLNNVYTFNVDIPPVEESDTLYAHTIKFVDKGKVFELTGDNINFIPVNSTNSVVKFDGQILAFTDLLKGDDYV
jgi:hypothetical protein